MWQKVSPEPMENSSGYVSNTNSMNPTVKYATVGRNRPGGVKRTSSLIVSQPVVPNAYKTPPPKRSLPAREVRKHYKNDLGRPASQASRSSANSGNSGRGGSRRSSHSKVRRPESRTSSKALIMRRREPGRAAGAPQGTASTRASRDERPDSRGSNGSQRARGKHSRSLFSWKPRLTLRRSKSLQVKPEPAKKREIRFGDESQPNVIMMKGVEHRRYDSGGRQQSPREASAHGETVATKSHATLSSRTPESPGRRLTQTLTRPAKRSSPPSRSQRASSADVTKRLEPVGESPGEDDSPHTRRYRPHEASRSLSPAKARAPSELSSSPPPRAPVWRAGSEGSLSDTLTNRSQGSTVRSGRRADKHAPRSPRSRAKPDGERRKDGVMGFLRRTFSIKPKDKPKPAPVKKRERASSSSLSSLERPARHSKLKTAKSHEALTVESEERASAEKKKYRSLPRAKHKSTSTTLSRRLSSLGWSGAGGPSAERSRSFKSEREYAPRNNERPDLTYPSIPPKATNEATRGRPRHALEEPIQPIIQERRALSQPSLYQPDGGREPPQEPFTHYANLPFQLAARHRSSPDLADPLGEAAALPGKRAVSQPSLLARPTRSASPRSSASSSTLYAPPERPHSRGRPAWKPAGSSNRKGILKRQKSSERRLDGPEAGVKNTNVTRDATLTRKQGRPRQQSVFHDIAHNIKNVFRHRKHGEKHPGGSQATPPGNAVVSERFVNVTSTHEEKESGREEEEVHHLGDVSNEELSRAIREGVDARSLVRQQSAATRPGQLADPRAGQRRLTHQHGKTWRTVDTDDLHETSRHDRNGELVTDSAHTHQREEFNNVQVPDDGSDLRDGDVREDVRSSSLRRRHTKDVDMLEHFSVPKGGRPGDGIKLGDGLRYVQENVEEERRGDEDAAGTSERMRELHRLGFRPQGHTSTPIEYPAEEKTRRRQISSWLNSHFGSESGRSHSSEDEARQRSSKKGRDEPDRRRETSTYEFQKSSGTTQKGASPPVTWERSEKYTQEVRETPERTYIKETRQAPRGSLERTQVLPAGAARGARNAAMSDMQSEADEDPIFASKFSSGKPRSGGGVTFSTALQERPARPAAAAPPAPSPPPSPPPRHKRKNRLKQSPPQSVPPAPQPPAAREPSLTYEHRREVREAPAGGLAVRQRTQLEREVTPSRVEERREDGRLVREYHFRSSESPHDSTPARRTYREESSPRRDDRDAPQRPARRGSSSARESPPRPSYYLGQRDRSRSTDEPDSGRDARYTSTLNTRLGERRHHKSSDELERRSAEPYRAHTIDRRLGPARRERDDAFQSQTLPRKPRETPPSTRDNRLAGASHFGGSMINVSVRNNVRGNPPAPRKPARSPVRRSNSLYSAEARPAGQAASVGLKSPDIISQIQRTASIRPEPADAPANGRRADDEVRRRNTENVVRSSAEHESSARSTVIPVSVEPDAPRSPSAKVPPKVAPKPRPAVKENFMRGLMQTAPELYSALHGDERKDSKTPSPKQSPPLTPPPPLHRARSPASPAPLPLDYGVIYPKTPPVFKRIERLRADEEVVTKDGRSRSATPAEDVHNFRLGTMSPTGERSDFIKVQR
ncbi:serine/arginine repetitive matrix protein 2-like [Pollicipes pollicipes]|uniref:serine/arginine repetitive matrix protein 2-like n=1 Tax=Pollicipes pollicipes TaxID=41117 RepID=UPI001884A236|nr:serine/arginine repetitive matrix protein 2-like [Pollicipes pollicipes]